MTQLLHNRTNYYNKAYSRLLIILFLFVFLLDLKPALAESYRFKDEGVLTIWYNDLKGSLDLGNPAFDLNTNFKSNGNFKTQVNPGLSWKYNKDEKLSFLVSNMNTEQTGRFSAYALNGGGVFVNGTKFGTNSVELIDGKLNFNRVNLLMSYDLMGDDENCRINLLAGGELFKFAMDLSGGSLTASSVYSRKAFLPLAGIGANFKLSDIFAIRGNYYGMSYNFNDGDSKRKTTVYNAECGIEYHILPKKDDYILLSQNETHIEPHNKIEWFIEAGYIEDYFKEEYKKNKIILRHLGPYLRLAGRF